MQENVKVMIDKVAVLRKVVGKYMMRNFKDMPLTGDQSRLLFVIKEHGHSQKEVAQYLHISDATLSVRIKRLEEAGYIIREQNPQDKRHSTVRLSKLGEEYLETCKDKMRHMEEVCSRGLTKEDHDAVLHMIDMIIKNMEKDKYTSIIHEELNKLGISNKIIYGSVPVEEREKTIEEFKNKEIQVLITNPHTMAESVSLHKQCHDAIYFEYSFNLTHMLQSRDRINRLGLNENQYTQYYYLFLMSKDGEDDSIDFKTYNRLKEKEQVMLDAIEGERIVSINFDVLDDLKCIMNNN